MTICPHCFNLGYDASGQRCVCQPHEPVPLFAWAAVTLFVIFLWSWLA